MLLVCPFFVFLPRSFFLLSFLLSQLKNQKSEGERERSTFVICLHVAWRSKHIEKDEEEKNEKKTTDASNFQKKEGKKGITFAYTRINVVYLDSLFLARTLP